MHLVNLADLAAERMVLVDNDGKERLLVVVKGTYRIENGQAIPDPAQEKVCLADVYAGEPDSSSLKQASDVVLFKPATDVIFEGCGYAKGGRDSMVDFSLQVGELRKKVRIFGDRYWEGGAGTERIAAATHFERMPIVFERAFGGRDDSNPDAPEAFRLNPVGMGFIAKQAKRPVAGRQLPNLEYPHQPIQSPADRPAPAGTGFVAPAWESRYLLAGSYDDAWQRERAPFLPDDFSPRYYQTAPPDQVYPGYLRGGEPVLIENGSPMGTLSFRLPEVGLDVEVMIGGDTELVAMALDTVVIDGEMGMLTMTWRGNISVHNRIYRVRWIRVAQQGRL